MSSKSRSVRCILGAGVLALSGTTLAVANQAPASATAVAGSGYAVTTSVCNSLGLYTYQGNGFDAVRAIRFVWGQGWVVNAWTPFTNSWDSVVATSPIVSPGQWSLLYVQYASHNVVDGSWSYAGEWVKQGAGYWCQA